MVDLTKHHRLLDEKLAEEHDKPDHPGWNQYLMRKYYCEIKLLLE